MPREEDDATAVAGNAGPPPPPFDDVSMIGDRRFPTFEQNNLTNYEKGERKRRESLDESDDFKPRTEKEGE